jgi:hypothetical protein
MVLLDGIAHFSAFFCQQIESSGRFTSYNFNNSLQPDDVVLRICRVSITPGPIFCPSGRTIVLDDLLRKPFVIFLVADL